MDDTRFDALTRMLSTRRTALAGLLGGLAALLGLATPAETVAHNLVPLCKKVKDPKRRRACLRRARAHNRKQHSCKPKPKAVTCKNRCGQTLNNCNEKVGCTCPPGKRCLANKGCIRTCQSPPTSSCPAGCTCGIAFAENPALYGCFPSGITCAQMTPSCDTNADCPRGFFCGVTSCLGPINRCIPNCPV
jgi:hypothetical protein